MVPYKLKFRFPKGLSLFTKAKLKKLCRSVDFDAPGCSDIDALIVNVENNYKLHLFLTICNNSAVFAFEH